MFDAAVAQASPGDDKAAICVGMRGLGDDRLRDAPASIAVRLSRSLHLPAVPASRCGSDLTPFVTASGAKAILYSVRVDHLDAEGVLSFWGEAVYGNLGANGREFRLVRRESRWVAEPTGLMVVS